MKPTPEQIAFKQAISGILSTSKSTLVNLFEETVLVKLFEQTVEAEQERILTIVRNVADMDEMTNRQMAEHLEWAVKGGDDD